MKTEVMNVTPMQAREWLQKNTANRLLRDGGVARWRAIWDRNEWRLTHQGIAFREDGVLLDGQHRLTFISELPDTEAVPLMVSFGLGADVFGAIDVGVKRTVSDACKIPTSLAAIAQFLGRLHDQVANKHQTAISARPYIDFAIGHYEALTAFCNSSRQVWSSTPIRAAAVIQMARGHNADFVKSAYRSLVLRDVAVMPPTAQALFRQVLDGKAGSSRSVDLFIRALRAFDSMAPSISKIQVADLKAATDDIRHFLDTQVGIPRLDKKKAPPKRGNKN